MAPKPSPLDQGETFANRTFGCSESEASRTKLFSFEEQENLEPPQQNNHNEDVQPLKAKYCGPIRPIVHIPKRSSSFFQRQQLRDPARQIMARNSLSHLSLVSATSEPPGTEHTTQFDAGMMLREGDFLDRTFDNLENATCHRTSISKAPPAPIFSCNSAGNGQHINFEVANDIAALSSAKQQGYKIEQFDKKNDEDPEGHMPTSGPPWMLGDSKLEEKASGIETPAWRSPERAVEIFKKNMAEYIFENFHSLICREDRLPVLRNEVAKQVALPQLQQLNSKDHGAVDEDAENGKPSPLNLHQTMSDSKSEKMKSVCQNVFTNREASSTECSSEIYLRNPSLRRDALFPIRHEDDASSTLGSIFRTGTMLLADGSIMVPEEHSNRWIQRQERRATPYSPGRMCKLSSTAQKTSSNSSIHLSRERSLMDRPRGSGESSEGDTERTATGRHQKCVYTHGGCESVVIPRQTTREKKVRGFRTNTSNQGSAEDIECQHFWKQIAFAATVLLLACGLTVFAMSFFWPSRKIA
jgi:hypothetical protein